mgnify:CR=1 FL=1
MSWGRFKEELGWGIGLALSVAIVIVFLPPALLMRAYYDTVDWIRKHR